MFAQILTFTLKSDGWARALGTLGPAEAQMSSIPGLRSWVSAANTDTGEGVAVMVFEDMNALEASKDGLDHILSGFMEALDSPPSVKVAQGLGLFEDDWKDDVGRQGNTTNP